MTRPLPLHPALLGLVLLLGSCQQPPPDTAGLRLTPLPGLSVRGAQLQVTGNGPLRVACDTPAGPVVRTLPRAETLPVPPGALSCEAALTAAPEGRVTLDLTQAQAPQAQVPQTQAPQPPTSTLARPGPTPAPPLSGTLRVTPGEIGLGEREVWTVTAELSAPGGRPAPDGTPVLLQATAGTERLSAVRLTVSGVARWQLTPATPGQFTFTAQSGDWQARARASARSGLLGGRPRAVFTGRVLTLGPLRWKDGAMPDDGTPVRLRALSRAGTVVWTADVTVAAGQVRAEVPRLPGAVTLRAELAGSEVSFAWP